MRLSLLSVLILAVVLQNQEPFTFRVDVNLVALDVQVSDALGKPVTTLTRDDFEIYENGQPQTIASFAPVDSPYSVLLLFDCSRSTEPNWPFLVESMNRFLAKLRAQDRIAVAQFGSSFRKLLDWRPGSDGAIDVNVRTSDRSCDSTDFYGAVDRAHRELRSSPGRKGVIVLTDGEHGEIPEQRLDPNNTSLRRYVNAEEDGGFQKVLRVIKGSDIVFYFVAVNTDLNPDPRGAQGFDPRNIYNKMQVRSRMELLAEDSGGRVVFPRNPEDVIPLFEQIGYDLGTSYGLGYTPANPKKDGEYRKIEVRVRNRSLQVRQSRPGY